LRFFIRSDDKSTKGYFNFIDYNLKKIRNELNIVSLRVFVLEGLGGCQGHQLNKLIIIWRG